MSHEKVEMPKESALDWMSLTAFMVGIITLFLPLALFASPPTFYYHIVIGFILIGSASFFIVVSIAKYGLSWNRAILFVIEIGFIIVVLAGLLYAMNITVQH